MAGKDHVKFSIAEWASRSVIDSLRVASVGMEIGRYLSRTPGRPSSHPWIRIHLACTKLDARLTMALYLGSNVPRRGGHWYPMVSLPRMLIESAASRRG